MEYLKFLLEYITSPSWWIIIGRYSKVHDEWLLNAMEHYKFQPLNSCEAVLDGKIIWTENYPYSSFTPRILSYETGDAGQMYFTEFTDPRFVARPSRFTIYKANKKYMEDLRCTY